MDRPSAWRLKYAAYGFLDFLIMLGLSKHQAPRVAVEKFVRRHKSVYAQTSHPSDPYGGY